MGKAILLAFTSAKDAASVDAYHRWYDEEHVPDVLDLPGVIAATRYDLGRSQLRDVPLWAADHLAVYEIETEDLDALLAEWRRRMSSGRMVMRPALQADGAAIVVYDVRTPSGA